MSYHLYRLLLLLARLINRHVEVLRGFGRRCTYRFHCQCGRLQRAVEKVVGVMRRMITVLEMVARFWVDSVHELTKDSAVTGAQLSQHSSRPPWQCLFGCCNGRRSAIRPF